MSLVKREIFKGTTWRFETVQSAYPAGRWSLVLNVAGVDILGEAGTDGVWRFHAPVSVTGDVAAGWATWSLRAAAVFSDDVDLISHGHTNVIETIGGAAGEDRRGWAEKTLEAVEAVLSNSATLTQKKYQINNRSLERHSLDELMNMRKTLRAEVQAERAAQLGASPIRRTHLVRFNR